jgi:hypothetical protein
MEHLRTFRSDLERAAAALLKRKFATVVSITRTAMNRADELGFHNQWRILKRLRLKALRELGASPRRIEATRAMEFTQ